MTLEALVSNDLEVRSTLTSVRPHSHSVGGVTSLSLQLCVAAYSQRGGHRASTQENVLSTSYSFSAQSYEGEIRWDRYLIADFCFSEQNTVCSSCLSKLVSHTLGTERLCNHFIGLHKSLHSMGYAFGILEVSFFESDLFYKITHIPAQLAAFACIIAAFSSPDFSSKTRAGLLVCIFIKGKNPK